VAFDRWPWPGICSPLIFLGRHYQVDGRFDEARELEMRSMPVRRCRSSRGFISAFRRSHRGPKRLGFRRGNFFFIVTGTFGFPRLFPFSLFFFFLVPSPFISRVFDPWTFFPFSPRYLSGLLFFAPCPSIRYTVRLFFRFSLHVTFFADVDTRTIHVFLEFPFSWYVAGLVRFAFSLPRGNACVDRVFFICDSGGLGDFGFFLRAPVVAPFTSACWAFQ